MPKRSQPCQCAGLSNSSGLFPELYVLTHCVHAPFPGQTNEPPVTWCPWLFCSSPTFLYVSLRNCPHLHRSLNHGCNLELKTSTICKMNHSLLAWQAVEITSKTAPSAFLENPQNLRHYSVQKPNCDKPTQIHGKKMRWLFVLSYYWKIIFLLCVFFNRNQHVHSHLRGSNVKPLPICWTHNLHWRLRFCEFISWTVIWRGPVDVELNNLD